MQVRTGRIHPLIFFPGSWNQLNPPKTGGHSHIRLVLTVTVLPRLQWLDETTVSLNLSGSVRSRACVAACTSWYRNLNRFPIRQIRLRSVLGPTYPRLTTHCRGTLAPSTERILTSLWLLLPPGSATADGPLDLTAQLPPERCARLPPRM